MQYRPEIDGLRSFAILPVLLFHAGFSWMPGGFLGVDIFFVISGYLITSIILNEHRQQRFSLLFFYERRARRILPALFFVLSLSLIAGWLLLSPQGLIDLAQSIIATNLFAANIYFWQHIDYFTGNTNLIPLLHLWSLGIEEQFYVFLPLLFMALWHRSTRTLVCLLVVLGLLSLLSTQILPTDYSSAAFYLLPTRAWELLAGSLCAFALAQRRTSPQALLANTFSALGVILVLISVLGLSPQIQHPGLWTLLPVLGTVFIILYAQPATYAARILSYKPFVVVGLLSYSAYLWHQPLFAYTRIYKGQEHLGIKTTLALIVLTFALAAFSWRFVEQPFRNRQFLKQRTVLLGSACGMGLFIAVSALIVQQQGFPSRFNAVQQVLYQYQSRALEQHSTPDPCFLNETTAADQLGPECRLQPDSKWVLIGDSHAQHLAAGLPAPTQRPPLYTASGCAPIKNIDLKTWRPYCRGLVDQAFADIARYQPPIIMLHANWLMYEDWIQNHASDKTPLGTQLRQTTDYLRQIAPHSQIVVIGDVPQWQPSLIELLAQQAALQPLESPLLPNTGLSLLYDLEEQIKSALGADIQFISLLDYLCTENQCQALMTELDPPAPMAWDYGHLTEEGAQYLGRHIQSLVDNKKVKN